MPAGSEGKRTEGFEQWHDRTVRRAVVDIFVPWFVWAIAAGICGLSCGRSESPQPAYDHALRAFLDGNLEQAQDEAHQQRQRLQKTNIEWAWKLRVLEADALLWRGLSGDALAVLSAEPEAPRDRNVLIEKFAIEAVAHARLHSFSDADRNLKQAENLCSSAPEPICGTVLRARGVLEIERGQLVQAREFFERSLQFARHDGDHFLEATALLNLSASSLREEHFDEAVDWAEAAYRSADAIGARSMATKALGNLGWAYYNLGDLDRALQLSLEAQKRAFGQADIIDRLSNVNNAGYVYSSLGGTTQAKNAYKQALNLANSIGSQQHIYNALRALALVSNEGGELDDARLYSDQAFTIAHADNNRLNELYPLLVKGLIDARSHDREEAGKIFHEVDQDPNANASLKWRSEHALAQLYEDEGRDDVAESEYRTAIATFEAARSSLQRNDSKLPFSNNASSIYGDYIRLLVARGKTEDALRWADYGRARTLAEGLGLLAKASANGPPSLNPQAIAKRAGGAVLFYWLGEKQSYLWTITPQRINLSTLPAGAQINAAVQRYRKSLGGPQDVLASADADGIWLYRTLVAPAQASAKFKKDAKVFIIPDGSLNNLNFETLLVPPSDSGSSDSRSSDSRPRDQLNYWIEDATIANASSLRVLGAANGKSTGNGKRSLLLVGNSISPSEKYPELPKAASQMDGVAQHFPADGRRIFAREQATPAAYLSAGPEKFSYIHFVAHGTASSLSPLDSAIVLSKSVVASTVNSSALSKSSPFSTSALPSTVSGENDSFKLYARDIINHPLHADLVTISACYGAGERAYSGEGLVGLSWAFLRAGAHNVVAALWEATDSSTEQLMDKFYDDINKGASPDAALRDAKLALLHGSAFRNPFYWAPFQLYAGS